MEFYLQPGRIPTLSINDLAFRLQEYGYVSLTRSAVLRKVSRTLSSFPEIDAKRTSSTNMSERTIREVRRRSWVIGIFPTIDSWGRLNTCYLMEDSEDWRSDRSYIKREKIQEAMERSRSLLTTQEVS